jgi:hydroxymethylpyrimidine kinase/phosphomethylpyrimidine kinase
MFATSGDALIRQDAVATIMSRLFPRALVITPNLAEAAFLTGLSPAADLMEMEGQARALLSRGARAVLIKGGHSEGPDATDLLVTPESCRHFHAPRLATRNTHGTGCTLSAAIAAFVAQGEGLEPAIEKAKAYITNALAGSMDWSLGQGPGPVHHFHASWPSEAMQ